MSKSGIDAGVGGRGFRNGYAGGTLLPRQRPTKPRSSDMNFCQACENCSPRAVWLGAFSA
ncbi:hypothetical protein PR003_g20424 [Phytophthora rubi]|uniref:Uncharacterized protein n=1 Tax=Phytophthora rubi TaxID=129364 RepID=A0A6A4DJZ8_9STRA|nr:hypothetical protein PR003_g20424 [Phytophthora rubi]